MEQQISPTQHVDKIASFNIQNKYEHTPAAELLISEELSFIAFQEPYGAQNHSENTWKNFSKCELQSARIDCYETQFQIILIDTWKWGGKTISPMQSSHDGRIMWTAFNLGKNNKLGIISIYASSTEVHSNCSNGVNAEIIQLIKSIRHDWKEKFQDINIIFAGDFQETCSDSDKDNIGTFRKNKNENGILAYLEGTHESIARKYDTEKAYITRYGSSGGRGIDHILTPLIGDSHTFFPHAKIRRDAGATFFSSDHSLITCDFVRLNDRNNNEDSEETVKYNYSKIYRIKIKSSGINGQDIILDDKQFKDSDTFREQFHLYEKLQHLTADNSNLSNNYLSDLEARLNDLTESIWKDGINQKCDGNRNKLVRINESQALEISYISRKFNHAIKETMEELKLVSTQDTLGTAGLSRGRLRKREGFRIFQNLPITTKLRYLKMRLRSKRNLVLKAKSWLHVAKLGKINNSNQLKEEEFWKIRNTIVQTHVLQKHAKTISSKLNLEATEREAHINAIRHSQKRNTDSVSSHLHSSQSNTTERENFLPFLSDNMTNLINSWLQKAGCTQKFNVQRISKLWQILNEGIEAWKLPLTEFIETDGIFDDDSGLWERLNEALENCEKCINSTLYKISSIQSQYRKSTLHYFLQVNTIDSFTRKVLHKPRSAPTTHSIIWDDELQDMRPCKNETEEIKATSEFHGNWMADSKASENCAFATVKREGKLGPRGIELHPNRKITMKDIPKLIHNGERLTRKIRRAFVAAHNKHTSKLFKYPKKDRKEFFYPFFLQNKNGKMNEESMLEKCLWKSLAGVPGKARNEGYQIATLGRFGKRWRLFLLRMIKLMLVMRYIPADIKRISRYPIPKPGKSNEYRPISLCDDLYCFLNGIVTSITSKAIENTGLLHEAIAAYRRGKSCATLVAVEVSFREDCIEGNRPAVQLDEDEEKFFDRVCLEIILAAMRTNGFPDTGFVELKASMMSEKMVAIITCKGTAYAKFVCGLEQGNPDSPTIANLVIKMKHDVWATISDEFKEILKRNKGNNCNRYDFNICDKDDEYVYIYMMGYCDDNTKYITANNEKDLIELVKYYVQLAGDLSMVTKIGRKSSKCDVQFYNITAKMTTELKKCWSTAWSFLHDAPIEEQVPFKVFLQEKEIIKFYELTNYKNLSPDEQDKWNQIVHSKAHRHLGLLSSINGDTSLSSIKTINKMNDRLSQLKIKHMDPAAQRKCVNMLVTSIHSFVPLQANHNQTELRRVDSNVASLVMKKNGFSHTDSKHRIFLPQSLGGLGFLSALEKDIISVARELEVICNGIEIDSRAFRCRVSAIPSYPDLNAETIRNHALEAIKKLGKYGIFLRDSRDDIVNETLIKIGNKTNVVSVGTSNYKDGNGFNLGLGKSANLKLILGGKIHCLLCSLQEHHWIPNKSHMDCASDCKLDMKDILSLKNEAQKTRFMEITNFYSFWEWDNFKSPNTTQCIPENQNMWEFKDMQKVDGMNSPDAWRLKKTALEEKIKDSLHINWNNEIIFNHDNEQNFRFNTYSTFGKILQYLNNRGSPMIIATDGSHQNDNNPHNNGKHITSSAFVICSLDIRKHETIESLEWINRPTIPLLSRCTTLPQNIGTHPSDIAHGECFAFALQELSMSSDFPRIIITDSAAVRDQMKHIREMSKKELYDRKYIRGPAGGISKFLTGIIQDNLPTFRHKSSDMNTSKSALWMRELFLQRNRKFIAVAQTWISIETSKNCEDIEEHKVKGWNAKYFDDNNFRCLIKVDSHQLSSDGTRQSKPPRYQSLVPNMAMLNPNHHADRVADLATKLHTSLPKNLNQNNTGISIPTSQLNYFLTWNDKLIDKHVSTFLQEKFDEERLKKLKTKSTQGLLYRTFDHVTISWKTLSLHKGFLRSLLGMSNTHTRCLYKSTVYKHGSLMQLINTINDPETRESILQSSAKDQLLHLTKCTWCGKHGPSKCKGNRRHMMLECSNKELQEFRQKLANTIGMRLISLFRDILKITDLDFVEKAVKDIEKGFLDLQESQVGRIKKLPKTRNIQYVNSNDLLKKHAFSSLNNCLMENGSAFFRDLFGMHPEQLVERITDEEIGILDMTWLGLMPTSIDSIMKNIIRNCIGNIFDKDEAAHTKTELHHQWNEVITLIMGKAIGLHRIINNVGENITNKLKKLHPLPKPDGILKRKRSTPRKSVPQKLSKKVDTPTVQCGGITCGELKTIWCKFSNIKSNAIGINRKHCQRCSVHCTASHVATDILIDIKSCDNTRQKKFINIIRSTSAENRNRYTPLMNELKVCIPYSKHFTRAQYISKQRPTEKWKRICNTIFNLVQHVGIQTQYKNPSEIIQQTIDFMKQNLNKNATQVQQQKRILQSYMQELQNEYKPSQQSKAVIEDINEHSLNNIKTPTSPSTTPTVFTIDTTPTPPNEIISIQTSLTATSNNADEPIPSQDIDQMMQERLHIMNPRNLMSGATITMAIEVLRDKFQSVDIYIACSNASEMMASWSSSQGWPRFARIFYNHHVCHSKPNGLYLIPMFESNHWYLVAVYKNRRVRQAAVIDSLGSGNACSTLHNIISDAFTHSRGRPTWTTPTSIRQQRVECGSRVICMMQSLCISHRNGETFEQGLRNATLTEELDHSTYNQMDFRRRAATVISEYRRRMRSEAVRIRLNR